MSFRAPSRTPRGFGALAIGLLLIACAPEAPETVERRLEVIATAYSSSPGQTQGDPSLGAWGDRLQPGVKAIAVSRDLLKMGLRRGTAVRVDGLDGEYLVLDKMNRRWRRKIDIYMGNDEAQALEWGRKAVTIQWTPNPSKEGS
jgi:3D (Asp-Asp-Asp) domain-containing protein